MTIQQIITELESWAPISLQESYDNCGLITGNKNKTCTGALCTLDVTEKVIEEALKNKCNLIIAHHPIIFNGLKKITGKNYVERIIIAAIKNDIAIYAIHTNLDNVMFGVNAKIADKLQLTNRKILVPKKQQLKKLYTYITPEHVNDLKNKLFDTGAGNIGNYSECSFSVVGKGSFKGNHKSNPKLGTKNKLSVTDEVKIEIIFPTYIESQLITELKKHHYYEEVAYEIISLDNTHQEIGSGLIGTLAKPITPKSLFMLLKKQFKLKTLRHSIANGNKIKTIAVCGGSGSSFIFNALAAKSDAYITADLKYHEFFEADNQMLLIDIGHYESEQFTIDLIFEQIRQKFPNFAVLKTKVNTNSVQYFV
jgi:dinuclear metal center YbgI/SA1388 family protein